MLDNGIKMSLVNLSIIDRHCNTLNTESSSSTNSMQVCFGISLRPSICSLSWWNIIIDNQLCLWDVNTSSDEISGDQHVNLLVSKLLDSLVTLLFGHFGEHDEGMEACLSQHLMYSLCIVFWIYENECLSRFTYFEYFFQEVQLFTLFTFVLKLLNML